MAEEHGEVVVYRSKSGGSTVQLKAVGGTVWLSQRSLADLYGTSVQNIQQIIARILEDGEADQGTINSELIVRLEGAREIEPTPTRLASWLCATAVANLLRSSHVQCSYS